MSNIKISLIVALALCAGLAIGYLIFSDTSGHGEQVLEPAESHEDHMTADSEESDEQAGQDSIAVESAATESEEQTPEASAPTTSGGRTYTVQSGDTLWKIADEMYGKGSQYMKIFEANSDLLEHPDRIFPVQELTIP